eukprot:11869261-Alexandrium_andersonii.AAC.2
MEKHIERNAGLALDVCLAQFPLEWRVALTRSRKQFRGRANNRTAAQGACSGAASGDRYGAVGHVAASGGHETSKGPW